MTASTSLATSLDNLDSTIYSRGQSAGTVEFTGVILVLLEIKIDPLRQDIGKALRSRAKKNNRGL